MKINQQGFSVVEGLIVLVVVGAIAGVGWFVYQRQDKKEEPKRAAITSFEECKAAGYPIMESYPEQCSADGRTFVNETQDGVDGWRTRVKSGKGAFEVTFPDGFGEVVKPLDSDSFYLMGLDQPEIKNGGKISINELESFGTDSPSVFSIVMLEEGQYDKPLGNVSDYTLVNGKENSIKGKKYSYIYEEDEPEADGIGQRRLKNDRNYVYIFPVSGGKTLYISYHVYAQDPSNNVEHIETLIDTIRLL